MSDDGRGFSDDERLASERSGHVGLTLLQELVAHSGGRLDVASRPGRGTRVELEVAT